MYRLVLLGIVAAGLVSASTTYTSSAAFETATDVNFTEDFATFSNGQDITSGSTLDGVTYSDFVLIAGATDLYATNVFESVSGLDLGVDHTSLDPPATYFGGGEGATLTFAEPVTAFGMFFNVNLGTGTFSFTTSNGDTAVAGTSAYDSQTFVFAGIVSDTPFTSITFTSTDNPEQVATYTIPEFFETETPEPATYSFVLLGVSLIGVLRARQVRRGAQHES